MRTRREQLDAECIAWYGRRITRGPAARRHAALTVRKNWTDFYGTGGVTIEIAFTNTASYVEGELAPMQKICRLAFARGLDRLVDDWKQYLYDYPAKMTRAEIEQYLSDSMASHGVSADPLTGNQ